MSDSSKNKNKHVDKLEACYDSFMTNLAHLRISKAFNQIEVPKEFNFNN